MTPKQRRFVEEYLVDLNGAQAAIRAGYSAKTADRQGYRLLRNAEVADAVKAAQAERSERTAVKADRVVRELAYVAFSNLSDVVSWTDTALITVKPSAELDQGKLAAIARIRRVPTASGPLLEVTMVDKMPALLALARHLGIFAAERHGFVPEGPPTKVNIILGEPSRRKDPCPED